MFPLISIIVVTYNAEKTLGPTLSSIKNLKYPNIEVILVDGLSSDQTVVVAKNFGQLINYLIVEKDSGIYDAMNKGINVCNGEWTIFMNAGDMFHENFNITLEDIQDKRIDVVFGNVVFHNENKNWLSVPQSNFSFRFGLPFCHQSCLTRVAVLKNRSFNIAFPTFADYDFFASIYCSGSQFKYINNTFSVYDINGVSSNFNFTKIIEKCNIVNKYFGLWSASLLFLYLVLTLTLKTFAGEIILKKISTIKLNIFHGRNFHS